MKRFILVMAILAIAGGVCQAEPIDISTAFDKVIEKAPDVKEGVLYSFDDNKAKISNSFDLIAKNDFALELGGIAEDNEIFIGGSYHLIALKEKGVTIWILDLIDINVFAGYGLKEIGHGNEGDPLAGATLFKWKI